MAGRSSEFRTMAELLKDVKVTTQSGRATTTRVLQGLTPKPLPRREGLFELTPEEMLNIRVPTQHIAGGKIRGHQRPFRVVKARSVARALHAGKEMEVVELSLTDDHHFATAGQHRVAGAIIAGKSLVVRIKKRTMQEAKELFTSARYATKISGDVLILASDDPFSEYIQDALTAPAGSHPWSSLVASYGSSQTRISPTSAATILRVYVAKTQHMSMTSEIDYSERFDHAAADELAELLSAFGTKQTNPLAFQAVSLRAIATAARAIFRDRDRHPDDKSRWLTYMTRFQFQRYPYVRSSSELADKMLAHFNRRLSDARQVHRDV